MNEILAGITLLPSCYIFKDQYEYTITVDFRAFNTLSHTNPLFSLKISPSYFFLCLITMRSFTSYLGITSIMCAILHIEIYFPLFYSYLR